MLEGNSSSMDDSLGVEVSHGNDSSQTHFRLHALGGSLSILSLQLLEDKQHSGGEDCNIPTLASS